MTLIVLKNRKTINQPINLAHMYSLDSLSKKVYLFREKKSALELKKMKMLPGQLFLDVKLYSHVFQRKLLCLLTEKEIIAAKATFNMLDVDGDGHIKEYEAVNAYRHWYRQLEKRRKRYEPRHEKTYLCHKRTTNAQISLCIRAVWSAHLHMQTTKAQISLRIRAVWSASLLFAA